MAGEEALAMPAQHVAHHDIQVVDPKSATSDEIRELAIDQIERRRRFRLRAISYATVAIVVTVIWAITEYHNAGGWPSDGFSQSSSIPHVWNIWIIYPLIGLALMVALDAWRTFGQRPISEDEVRREIERLAGPRPR
jgi:protein-S-isoprenylcysteine O-methyltransferase Ste14